MKIGGFQKFSLIDYPGYLAAIVFTQGCNFRCPYCHNPALVDPDRFAKLLDTETVLRFLFRRRKKLGAVVISGGEPSLQEDLLPFLRLLKAMRFKVKLDTNGSLPEVLQSISDSGLVDYYAMDIKAPLPLYGLVSRWNGSSEAIMQSMEIIRRAAVPYEFRSTYFDALLNHKDLVAMQNMLKPGDKFVVQECRYGDNLEQLQKPFQGSQSEESTPLPFSESPAVKELIFWGQKHHVQVGIRSL